MRIKNKISAIILWLLCGGFVFVAVFGLTDANNFMVRPFIHDDAPATADVIIVLGGGVMTDLKALPWPVQERIQRGVALYAAGYAPNMIFTGGEVKGFNYSESDIMVPYAEFLGVPPEAIYPENQATSTYENARFSREIMNAHNWRSALLVTSAYHTARACHVFKKQNINVTCVAAYESTAFRGKAYRNLIDFRSIMREYAATAYYWLLGYI